MSGASRMRSGACGCGRKRKAVGGGHDDDGATRPRYIAMSARAQGRCIQVILEDSTRMHELTGRTCGRVRAIFRTGLGAALREYSAVMAFS